MGKRLIVNLQTPIPEDFVACRNCGQLFSKVSVRLHVKKCSKEDSIRNVRDVKKSGILTFGCMGTIDDVVKCIKFDELIIKFGNHLCHSYSL